MGTYLNPNSRGFEISRNTKLYIDKSLLNREIVQEFVLATTDASGWDAKWKN